MRYVDSVVELIGNTPLVRLNRVAEGVTDRCERRLEVGVAGLGLGAVEMALLAEQSDQAAAALVGVEFVVGDDVAHTGLLVMGLRAAE